MSRPEGDELVKLDEATGWLSVHEQVADARDRLAAAHDDVSRVRIVRELARIAGNELTVLESRDALAVRELLALIDAGLSPVPADQCPECGGTR